MWTARAGARTSPALCCQVRASADSLPIAPRTHRGSVKLADTCAEDVVPRLLTASALTVKGANAKGATSAARRPNAISSDAQPGTAGPRRELQRQTGWMPRMTSGAKISSILTWLGLRRDGQEELEKLVGGPVKRDAAPASEECLRHTTENQYLPTSAAGTAWRQGADFATSAARRLQAALLGFRPFTARAHFGSHTYLHPVASNARLSEDGGGVAPQTPAQRCGQRTEHFVVHTPCNTSMSTPSS